MYHLFKSANKALVLLIIDMYIGLIVCSFIFAIKFLNI